MDAVVKVSSLTNFTLTRDAGNRLYTQIKDFLTINPNVSRLIFDFKDVKDVSVSFIQATIVKLSEEDNIVELTNINKAIIFKIRTLLNISKINPSVFKKVHQYPESPVYI
ncbi:MAG: hypothetical protein ISS28_02655 [Candidatus Cloacimonetes bacterium]|nr:hypothetical protein [Candidatus Cloacimonadota bacterium]